MRSTECPSSCYNYDYYINTCKTTVSAVELNRRRRKSLGGSIGKSVNALFLNVSLRT